MIKINLFDQGFVGQACSVPNQTPRLMRYVRDKMEWDGITVFTGQMMFDPIVYSVRSRYKIGWINGDARCLRPTHYENARQVAHKFDAVMTHDADLLASGAPFVKTIRGGSWVPLEQWGMYPKTKNISMILSEKQTLPGHQLRHAIAAAGLPIDLYGPQYTPIGHDKSIAYKDYRFAVVVEACREENWFTEHLLDALAYGCMPIYWGCPNYDAYFDMRGFGFFQNLEQLTYLLRGDPFHLDETASQRLAPIIQGNQDRARTYAITEDWQIEHALKPFVEAL